MDSYLVILFLGLFYTVLFGGLGLLKREGLSMQFTFEAIALTIVFAAGDFLTGSPLNPILFLAFIYVVTMRSRLLTDVANLFSNRGRQRDAVSLLQVALRLFPDKPTRLIVLVNMGVVQILRKNPKSAEEILTSVMKEAESGGLGLRYEAALHFNLGIALRDQGKDAQSVKHFREAAAVYPGSPFGKAAQRALDERRTGKAKKGKPNKEDQ